MILRPRRLRGVALAPPMGFDNPTHILLIALVIVLLFGAKRLPQLGRQLGRGIREVKDHTGIDEITSAPKDIRAAITGPVTQATAAPAEPVEKTETPAS
jgi:sec-independent protein translocase protein TatA